MSSPNGSRNWTEKRRKLRQEEAERKLRIASKQDSREAIRLLDLEIKRLKKQIVDEAVIRHEILKISQIKPPVPHWEGQPVKRCVSSPGVPTIFASDWHWGERVDPAKIGGINKYDLTIAHARAREFVEVAVDLLKNHMVNPTYPGIVLALGGDMISGDIHAELKETNDIATLPALVDLWGVFVIIIRRLADEFGHVFVPCVTGNHGRSTIKPQSKNRVETNYDWLLYQFLEKAFEDDERVRFKIASGSDVEWKLFDHSFAMTHGDQFKAGDSIIGSAGPIIRGDKKKKARNSEIGLSYDTLLLGHFHQLMMDQRRICNGSLVGYSEYAWSWNFPYEPPQQALFITHPTHGITFQMPIKVDKDSRKIDNGGEWVSWRN